MKRFALFVYANLDPVPGAFHTRESARANVKGLLEARMAHYEPTVGHAPDSHQPEDTRRTALIVYVNGDPTVPDPKRFALQAVRTIVRDSIYHYSPVITYAPRQLQPGYKPTDETETVERG